MSGRLRIIRLIEYIAAALLFALAFWGIHYTADWDTYANMFANDMYPNSDIAFGALTYLLKACGIYDYRVLFHIHVLLMALLYPLLFVKMRENPFFYVLLFVVINYVPVANQIRYYVAFPLAFLSIYYFVNEKYIRFAIIALLAICFHKTMLAIIALCAVFYLLVARKWNHNMGFICFAAGNILLMILLVNPEFVTNDYFEEYIPYMDMSSTFAGGLYNSLPSLLGLFSVFFVHRFLYKRKIRLIKKRKYKYLLTCSLATSVFLLVGFWIQILVHRMIFPLAVVWIVFLLYVYRNSKDRYLRRLIPFLAGFNILFIILHQTLIPMIVFHSGSIFSPELIKTISSYYL